MHAELITMPKLLDRLLLRSFLQAYIICFVSLISLYIVIELFNDLDDFIERTSGPREMLTKLVEYYSYNMAIIYDRLSGAITFLAAVFTMALLQRNNELLPILAAGIPTRRLLWPVLVGTLITTGAALYNREVIMPIVEQKLDKPIQGSEGEHLFHVSGGYEPNDILITGKWGDLRTSTVKQFYCTIPVSLIGTMIHVEAEEAKYIPPGEDPLSGGWLMTETTPAELPGWDQPFLEILDTGKFFLRTERIDFDLMTRTRHWHQFTSTSTLFNELETANAARFSALAVQLHMRMTQPVVTLIMVAMGLAVILRDQNRNVFISAGMCVIVFAVFFGASFFCTFLGEYEYISPPLSAWLPILTLGPLTLAKLDSVHT